MKKKAKWEVIKDKAERNLAYRAKALKQAQERYQELLKSYPYLPVYKEYFENLPENNPYAIIMKKSLSETLPRLIVDCDASLVAYVLNVDRTMIYWYKKSKSHPDYVEVVHIMGKMIKEKKYPYAKLNRETINGEQIYSSTYYEWK